MGFRYDLVFPVRERRISPRGGQDAVAQRPFVRPLSSIFLPFEVHPTHDSPSGLPTIFLSQIHASPF